MRLGIVIGHEKDKPGAVMAGAYSFISEYKFNSILAGIIKSLHPDTILAFRDVVGIAGAHKKIKDTKCDVCIELHFNSFEIGTAGTETLFGSILGSNTLASIVHKNMVKVYKREKARDRGVKHLKAGDRGGGNVNQPTTVPTVLIEPFFGSNPLECELGLQKIVDLAKCLVDAAEEYHNGVQRTP
jgi:N-acetylmuramoyl-L-alanine amidase